MTSLTPQEECTRRHKTEVDRYYQTVLLTLGLKDFIDSGTLGCKFISAEPLFKEATSNKEVFPDIVLQYDNDNLGILFEVKTSLSEVDFFLLEDLKQLELYSNKLIGWETSSKEVTDHSLALLCHFLDSDRVQQKITQWITEGKFKITKNFSIIEWSIVESLKYGPKDVFLIRLKMGETGCGLLDIKLRQNIKFEVDTIYTKYEKCRFVRKEPPVEYTMNQLWSCIFPALHEITEDFTCTIDEILEVAYAYYIPWSGLHGEYSQIRKKWIRKAMDAFCRIELAEKLDIPDNFRVFYGKQIQKDVSEYFVERICRNILEEARRKPIKDTLEEAQRVLAEFDKFE
ncbi:MAG: hypothetical protein ABSB71_08560 [Candidatus Bathyarchaeia archaeon]|jgi:hypothetical protein